jgi:membrane associated rhomboid family serine protease
MKEISVNLLIIVFTALVSYQGFSRYEVIQRLKHFPFQENRQKEYYRLLTYSFGTYIENYIVTEYGAIHGRIIFLLLFLLNIILANIPTLFRQKDNPSYSSIGASGAVSGIVFIFILMHPWSTLYLFFIVPLPAIVVGIAYLGYSSWAAKQGHGRIDHSAHFAGAVAGMAMMIILKRDILNQFFYRLVNEFPL